MHVATIHMNPVMPETIGFASAAGLPGDVRFYFKTQAGTPYTGIVDLNPQMVLRPFSQTGAFGYDIDIDLLNPGDATGVAVIPAPVMNDRFNVEVYTRNSLLQPTMMIASGRIDLHGYAYTSTGPLGPASYPVGPSGPAGPTGATGAQGPTGASGLDGVRGSRWYSGSGPPTLPDSGRVEGDMYLNEANGDVWRWSGGTWRAFGG